MSAVDLHKQSTPFDWENVVAQLRDCLKSGCTIRATDPSDHVLEILPNGRFYGGLTITSSIEEAK